MSSFIERLKNNTYLSDFFKPEARQQLVRYLVTGFSSAAMEVALLYVFKSVIRLSLIEANSVAYTIVFWFNFLMNRNWSFKSNSSMKRQLVMYAALFFFNLCASDFIIHFLSTVLGMFYILAKLFSIGAIVCWNFILYKKVIYK